MIEASEGLNVRVGAGPSSEKLSRGEGTDDKLKSLCRTGFVP